MNDDFFHKFFHIHSTYFNAMFIMNTLYYITIEFCLMFIEKYEVENKGKMRTREDILISTSPTTTAKYNHIITFY